MCATPGSGAGSMRSFAMSATRYGVCARNWTFTFGAWRRARARDRRQHGHLLRGPHGAAPAARLPGRRAHRLGRDALDQCGTHEPGGVRLGLSRLAGAEPSLRADGAFAWRGRCRDRGRRPRRLFQLPLRLVRLLRGLRPAACRRPLLVAGCPELRRWTDGGRRESSVGARHTSAAPRPPSGNRSRFTA